METAGELFDRKLAVSVDVCTLEEVLVVGPSEFRSIITSIATPTSTLHYMIRYLATTNSHSLIPRCSEFSCELDQKSIWKFD